MAVQNPPLVAYRRPPNLKSLLVRAAFRNPLPSYRGNSQCGQPRCKTCQHIKPVDRFKSSATGKDYRVKATANCKTTNIVYVIECNKCKLQYVGETENALHIRINGHRSDIKNRRLEKPVAKHFNLSNHSLKDLFIFVIEKIHRDDAGFRKAKESYWIQTLRSLTPEGLNLDP